MNRLPKELFKGYKNFRTVRFADEQELFLDLASRGQSPQSLVIGCCDSRVSPEVIFNAVPGQVFVVRNIANFVPPFDQYENCSSTGAALEYAVNTLKVRNIIILGHSECGGIKTLISPIHAQKKTSSYISKWLQCFSPSIVSEVNKKNITKKNRQRAAEHLSIKCSLRNLMTYPYISRATDRGELDIYGAWFNIETGRLLMLDDKSNRFVAI